MKNLFSFAALAALTMFAASCGNDDEAKRKADSTRIADSMATVHAKYVADSTRVADSMANVAKEMEAKRIADSTRVADSMANLKKPAGKPKTTTVPKTEPKVGGKR